jgi:hypothetical protein
MSVEVFRALSVAAVDRRGLVSVDAEVVGLDDREERFRGNHLHHVVDPRQVAVWPRDPTSPIEWHQTPLRSAGDHRHGDEQYGPSRG